MADLDPWVRFDRALALYVWHYRIAMVLFGAVAFVLGIGVGLAL